MTDTSRFDQVASTWDEDPLRVALARAVADAIARDVGLSASMDVLDFGCGTGLLTLALQPHVRSVTGADTSPGMLAVLEQKVRELGLESVRSCRLDQSGALAAAGPFDLITSSMALHHVKDVDGLFAQLRTVLREGGHVALADLDTEDGSFHPPEVTDAYHRGFDRAALRAQLKASGFDDVRDTTAFIHRRHGREYPVFLISARAAGAERRA
jgi:cyclopropane fatty-acyl-phospholipid synthase-like methyltransferase